MLANLKQHNPESVEQFLRMRNLENTEIPRPLAEYILQIDDAFRLNQKYRVITECAANLQKKYPNLSLSTCRNRIYDSITYFYSNNTATAEHWNNVFADRMEKLGDIALTAHDIREARVCFEKAREYRIAAAAAAVDPDLIKFKEQLVSPDVDLERMFTKGRKGILEQYRRGLEIIDKRDIPSSEKERLTNELVNALGIEDTEYEQTEN
jgi:hypothetical protein